MTYMHGVPAHLAVGDVVIGTEVGVEGLVVGVGLRHQIGNYLGGFWFQSSRAAGFRFQAAELRFLVSGFWFQVSISNF
jgi:hypothetical protein